MNRKQEAIEVLKITCLILLLVGLLFAITTLAHAAMEVSTEADVSTVQGTPGSSGIYQTPDTGDQQRPAIRGPRRKPYVGPIHGGTQQASQADAIPVVVSVPAAALTGINVSFKLDPRLFSGNYGGERWVSPPTYTTTLDTFDARSEGLNSRGNSVAIRADWIPADPDMVTVAPGQGNAVKITVKRAGESELEVTSQGLSKKLSIKAEQKGNVLQVQVSQKP